MLNSWESEFCTFNKKLTHQKYENNLLITNNLQKERKTNYTNKKVIIFGNKFVRGKADDPLSGPIMP